MSISFEPSTSEKRGAIASVVIAENKANHDPNRQQWVEKHALHKPPCAVEYCNCHATHKAWCSRHYSSNRRYGSPMFVDLPKPMQKAIKRGEMAMPTESEILVTVKESGNTEPKRTNPKPDPVVEPKPKPDPVVEPKPKPDPVVPVVKAVTTTSFEKHRRTLKEIWKIRDGVRQHNMERVVSMRFIERAAGFLRAPYDSFDHNYVIEKLTVGWTDDEKRQVMNATDLHRPKSGGNSTDPSEHPKLREVLRLTTVGADSMLVGPAGTGKSYMAWQVAEILGLGFESLSCTQQMSETKLLGKWLLTGGQGMDYHPADFIECFGKGKIFCLDEIDAMDPNCLLSINNALANGEINVYGMGKVHRHEDFSLIATANTFGEGANRQYSGRAKLDAASLDRFTQVEVGYHRPLEEKLFFSKLAEPFTDREKFMFEVAA